MMHPQWIDEVASCPPGGKSLEGISVVIPTMNDEATIGVLVRSFFAILPRLAKEYEVIVVNDGGTDATEQVLEDIRREHPLLKVVRHERNLGYGAALRSGFREASHAFVYSTDGDAQYSPAALAALLGASEGADLVQGYRTVRMEGLSRKLASRFYNLLLRLFLRLPTRDTNCGARLIRLSALRGFDLRSQSGFIGAELVARSRAAGLEVREAGVVEYPRLFGSSRFFRPAPLMDLAVDMGNYLFLG